MRFAALLLACCVSFAGQQQPAPKPGVTDPIKDPTDMPGHEKPGPVPRTTPQPVPSASEGERSRKKVKKTKKQPTEKTDKVNPSTR